MNSFRQMVFNDIKVEYFYKLVGCIFNLFIITVGTKDCIYLPSTSDWVIILASDSLLKACTIVRKLKLNYTTSLH